MTVPQPQILVEEARQAQRLKDPVRARSLLSQVIRTDPRNEEAWLLFAEVAEKKEHAIYSLEQVLKIDPVNMEALDRLNALKAPDTPPTPVNSPAATAPSPASVREAVILQQRMHRAMFISPVILFVLAIALEIFFSQLSFGITGFSGSFIVLLVIGAAIFELARTCIRYATSHIILTNKRIIIKRGYFNRVSFEILLTKVEGIGVKQSFLARLFGFGTLVVTGTGGARQRFLGLDNPQNFRERVQAEIEALR